MGRILIIAIATLGLVAGADIRETTTMVEVEKALGGQGKGTLLAFDLDNTIIESEQMLGSDQWYTYMKKHFLEQGYAEAEAQKKAIALWSKVQLKTRVRPVESLTPELFGRISKIPGLTLIGLTARPTDLVDTTLAQLEGVGVRFPRNLPEMDLTARPGNGMREGARYRGGILFVGENNKGATFIEFLKATKITPQRVFFVDDKSQHVSDMEFALSDVGIRYFGFRYGAADPKVGQFNFQVSEAQRRHFEKNNELLSDEAAGKIAKLR